MGAWGTTTFENDDAMDWIYELEAARDERVLTAAFDAVARAGDGYLESYECARALAAAEVVAALLGRPDPDLPPEGAAWVGQHAGVATSRLAPAAIEAANRVREGSELRELWEESDGFAAWLASVDDLLSRLKPGPERG